MGIWIHLSRNKFLRILISLILLTTTIIAIQATVSIPSHAGTSDKCDGSYTNASTGIKVTAQHGKIFYIDSGQGQNIDAAYVSYKIDNTGASNRKNIWLHLDSFVGGVVRLANPADENTPIGDINASSSGVGFVLLKAPTSSSLAQSHQVHVYLGNPNLSGATELYTCTFTFTKVMETIKARANKVDSITKTSASTIGSTFTITVEGDTGTMGQGNSIDGRSIWVTPASRSTWPTTSVRLESTSFDLFTNNGLTNRVSGYPKTNTLYFSIASQDRYYYRAIYTFRIIGTAGSSVPIKPVGQISSGTQMKHNDVSGITDTIDLSAATTSMAISKSMSSTATYDSGTQKLTYAYTVTLTNSGSASQIVDQIVDSPASGLTYKANSVRFDSAATTEPSTLVSDSTKLVFSGPFTVPANSSKTLTYNMTQTNACSSGSYSYTNSAIANLGQLTIGSGATTYSQVVGTGTCGSTTVTPTTTNPTLTPEAITQPATVSSQTAATLNASVDPNGLNGWSVIFEWGTTSSLSSTPITLASTTTTSTTSYSVSSNVTTVAATTYYYRIKLVKPDNTVTVYGEILNFTTPENVGRPTAVTGQVSNISVSGSKVDVTFNGSIDPNQVLSGVKVRFGLAKRTNQSSSVCTGNIGTETLTPTSSKFIQVASDTGTTDLILNGAFPTEVAYLDDASTPSSTYQITISNSETKYCFRIIGYFNETTTAFDTSVLGDWVPFDASNKSTQTITYSTPAAMVVGTSTTSYTASSNRGLAITYTSSDTSICTVNASTGEITAVSEGVCVITASQDGNDLYYAADPVTVFFDISAVSPTVTTVAASSVGVTTAQINGTINAGGASTTATLCYGTASNLTGCTSVTPSQSPVSGSTNTSISYSLTGLTEGTTYYFRASGTNSKGSADGTTLNFTTKVTVTYNGNGNTGGSIPTDDSSPYEVNSSVTVKTNSGNLAKTGYTFSGWNTASGGSGTDRAASSNFTIGTSSVVLYAKWIINSHNVSYDGNGSTGGSAPATSTSYNYGATVTVLGNTGSYVKTGYSFTGWNTAANGSGSSYSATNTFSLPDSNVTLYAQWSLNSYAISYLAGGGGGSGPGTPVSVNHGATFTVPSNTFTRGGYTFSHWTDSGGTSYSPGATYPAVSGNVSLTANWTALTYTINFDKNSADASGTMTSLTGSGQATVTLTNNSFSRPGYAFNGWKTASSSGTDYANGGSVSITSDTTLTMYAQWSALTYSITFNSNAAGTTGTMSTLTGSGASSVSLTTNAFERTGYTFTGWKTASSSGTDYSDQATVSITSNTTLTMYAQWTVNSYTVTYDGNGSLSGSIPTGVATYNYGSTVTVLGNTNNLAKGTDNFGGWNTASNGTGTTYAANATFTLPASNVTLYAIWTPLGSYTVTFNSNYGTPTIRTQSATTATNLLTNNFSRDGYTFGGWSETNGSGGSLAYNDQASYPFTSDKTLYAIWTAITYTINFDKNAVDASGSMSSLTGSGQSSVTITNNSFSRSGYTFNGWKTASSSGTDYANGATISLTSSTTLTLYAQWTALTHSISYDKNAVSATGTTTSQTGSGVGSVTLRSNGFSYSGFNFLGWSTSSGSSNSVSYNAGDSYSITSDTTITLYAVWSADTTYTITASTGANGSITPSGNVSVSSGGNQTFTITPNSGYQILQITVNGVTVSNVSTYSFTNVTSNQSISVTFQASSSGTNRGTTNRDSNTSNATNSGIKVVVSRGYQSQTPARNNQNSNQPLQAPIVKTETVSRGNEVIVINTSKVEVTTTNTNSNTKIDIKTEVPVEVTINKSDNKVEVKASNGWTGRVQVAVVNENNESDVQTFVDVVLVPDAPKPEPIAPTGPRNTVKWTPPESQVVKYELQLNGKSVCETVSTSCEVKKLIGPKSNLELFAIGNDNTVSPVAKIPYVAPAKPIPALVVNFALNSSILDRKAIRKLDKFVAEMKEAGLPRVVVEGHTDLQGNLAINGPLSKARAEVVARYLARFLQVKVAKDQYADTRPADTDVDQIAFATNRRTEVSVW